MNKETIQVTISHSTSLLSDISLMVTESTLVRNVSCVDATTFTVDGCFDFQSEMLPLEVQRIAFFNADLVISSVDTIFLSNSNIELLNFMCFDSVQALGDYFLCGCTSIKSLNLSCLQNVTTIGAGFLLGCAGLTSIDISSFRKLTNIGEAFLSCCPALESLNISVLKNITGIGNCYSDGRYYFLSGCSEVLLGGM